MWFLAALLSLLIGLSLGMLGGGGSILTTPVLVYALGVEPKEAIASSLLVVGSTSLVAMLAHAYHKNVRWRVGLIFGMAGMAGAYMGGRLASYLEARTQMLLFASMMVVAAVAMFRGRAAVEPGQKVSEVRLVLMGLIIGLLLGAVGAGGGFAIVPALVLLGGLQMKEAVGTSLLVIAMQSFAGFAGHASHVQVDLPLITVMSTTAIVGSLLGGRLTNLIPQVVLRKGFAIFVLMMAAMVFFK